MTQLTIVNHGESAAVILPAAMLESIGLRIGDVLDATLRERQLILQPAEDVARREAFEETAKDVFEKRRDAYQRLA
jgi:antitoxin component of MazEF toxin-antitoxin module